VKDDRLVVAAEEVQEIPSKHSSQGESPEGISTQD
jgi:hypothetical protein